MIQIRSMPYPNRVILACALLLAALFVPLLTAQTAILSGTVTDESGAVVPAASVSLTNAGSAVKTVTANGRGAYVFAGIAPGSYTVQASAPQMILREPVPVALVPGTQRLDLRLGLAELVQQVDVDVDAPPAVSTDPASNAGATVMRGSDLDALSDNAEDLMTDLQALAGPSAGPGGGSVFVDGFSGSELPPKESIREVRINQNPFAPEFDRMGLGRIEIITKPGADHWRGNLNYNFGTDRWNSRNPYSPAKAPLLLNEFENMIGGPIGKRVSFLLDANQNNVDNGSLVNAVTLDPATLTAAPFFETFRTLQRRTRLFPRLDYQLNDRHTLTFRYSYTHGDIDGAGIGGFDLISRGNHTRFTVQTIQAIETAVLSAQTINETRFQYNRHVSDISPNSSDPAIQVLGSFNGGGAQLGQFQDTYGAFELQNSTTLVAGTHTWRFGLRVRGGVDDNVSPQNFNGTYTFSGGTAPVLNGANQIVLDSSGQPVLGDISSIDRYRRTLLFQKLGYSSAQIRTLGGGPSQFSIAAGAPDISVHQYDAGIFAGDDWRLRPNLTASLGFRYDVQTNIHDWSALAPRVGMAWAPGAGPRTARPKFLVRVGFGAFYDRFPINNTLLANRYNGFTQRQFVVANPDFFPAVADPSALAAFSSQQVVQNIGSSVRAPRVLQTAATAERELMRNTTLSVTYAYSHGARMLRSQDINAPLEGTYTPGLPASGVYPLGNSGPVFEMQSNGRYNQQQLLMNVNSRVNRNVSLAASYALNKAMSDTDGVGTFPANPHSLDGEYGPASTDVRQRVTISGSFNTKWNVRLSPLFSVQSGPPFDITAGSDLYGTTLFNGRPGIASDPNRPGVIATAYGLLDPNPLPGEKLLSRNFGRGPGQMSLNLRVAKIIGFGAERSKDSPAASPGLRGIFSAAPSDRRYNLNISLSMRNLLNHTNPGPIIGNITSPLFGRANQMAGNLNGEGFSENASNRKMELQIKFTF